MTVLAVPSMAAVQAACHTVRFSLHTSSAHSPTLVPQQQLSKLLSGRVSQIWLTAGSYLLTVRLCLARLILEKRSGKLLSLHCPEQSRSSTQL